MDSDQELASARGQLCLQSVERRLHDGWLIAVIDHLQKELTGQFAVCVALGRPQVPDDVKTPELLVRHS